MRKVYTLCTNVIFTTPDLTFQMYVSISIRGKDVSIPGKDVSPEMPINRGMEVKGEGGEGVETVLSYHSKCRKNQLLFRRGSLRIPRLKIFPDNSF